MDTKRPIAIVQARMGSTRLPAKILKPLAGKPALWHVVDRLRQSRRIEEVVVATTVKRADDAVEAFCSEHAIACFRGSEEDVLDRYYQAALRFGADPVIRITSDCPAIDPTIVDDVIDRFLAGRFDLYGIGGEFPDGLDCQCFAFWVIEDAWRNATLPSEREHGGVYVELHHREKYRIGTYEPFKGLSHMRWTLDEEADLRFLEAVFERLYSPDRMFLTPDVLELLAREPALMTINTGIVRNEGLLKSLEKDKTFMKGQGNTNSATGITDKKVELLKRLNIKKSLEMQRRAKDRIPGLSQLLSKRPDLYSYGVWPGYFSRAKGAEVWDLDGNRYIDMSIGGIGANVLGYADPDVDQAVKDAIEKGTSASLNCPEEVELADLLCDLHPWAEMVRYARTGGESMAVAVRIARAHTGRDKIAFCGYHGWHDWYLAANLGTENALGEHLISGLDPKGVPKVLAGTALPFRYNKIDELRAIFRENAGQIAAIVMEPVRSDLPVPGFFDGVRELARENQSVLVIDEISAGFRMNTGGAHLKLGVEPDIAVFSKGLGNGYAIAAVIGRADVMSAAQSSFISSTNWTERIGPAAAIATVRKHQSLNAGEHLMKIGTMIQEGWKKLSEKHDLAIHVSGIPPLSHFMFIDKDELILKALYVQWMLERGFLASTSFYSMYAHRKEHVETYLSAADEVFALISSARTGGDPRRELLGQPAVTGFKRLN
jgi:glutamate-1-semialdehyde 2,1-aminomutase